MSGLDPVSLAVALALLALVPTLVVVTTSFLKIVVVMSLLRNALGIQQIPPNMALYGLALILSAYIMAPIGQHAFQQLAADPAAIRSATDLIDGARKAGEPLRNFMLKNSRPAHRDFFVQSAKRLWGPDLASTVGPNDFIVVMPSFLISELNQAFQMGFLIYLPFVIIDLVVSNILLALGMMMVSPVTISLPLKLFLFVMVDGWTRLIKALVLTYA
jgi:type III secretion protein R